MANSTAQLNPDNRTEAKGVGRGFLACLVIEALGFLAFAGALYLWYRP